MDDATLFRCSAGDALWLTTISDRRSAWCPTLTSLLTAVALVMVLVAGAAQAGVGF
jgi:hypothetical protein